MLKLVLKPVCPATMARRFGRRFGPLGVGGVGLLLVALSCFCSTIALAQSQTDWTAYDTTADTATGTLNGVSVFLSGDHVDPCVLDQSSTRFDGPFWTPSLPTADLVWIRGDNPSSHYSIAFGAPITNPIFHLATLASTISFEGGVSLEKLSGQETFDVSGSTVVGVIDGTTDANGTVQINGTFSSLSFNVTELPGVIGGDGIALQLLADPVSVPVLDTSGLIVLILALALLATAVLLARRKTTAVR